MENRLDELNWQTMNKEERLHIKNIMADFRRGASDLSDLKSGIDDIIWGNFRQKEKEDKA